MPRNGEQRVQWLPPMQGNVNPASLRFLNEPRAGSQGFIVREGNRLIHQNTGQRFKVRGTHLSGQARFLQDATAQNVAQTLSDLGYNWIRSQGDATLATTGNAYGDFWDATAADYKTFDQTVGDDNFMVRWDWTREYLARQGIYWEMMLSYNRRYPSTERPLAYQADTWPGSNNFGFGLYWMEPLRTWHRNYWTAFLTRPSAATGIPMINDPSIGMIYLHNEEGICDTWNRSTNYWQPASFSGQLRTDVIARWNAFAQSRGAPAQDELINPLAGAWGAITPDWTGAAGVGTADGTLQNTWMLWLMTEERDAANSDYAFLRSIGVKCAIMYSTANYVTKFDNFENDCLTMHSYPGAVTTGSSAGSLSLTRIAGSKVATTGSTGSVVVGDTIAAGVGFPTASWVTAVSPGVSVTMSEAATSTGGPTSSAFTHPYSLTAPFEVMADHTLGLLVYSTFSYRDPDRPFLIDESGIHAIPVQGACWYVYLGMMGALQGYDGTAALLYANGYGYPMTSMDNPNRPITGDEDIAHNPASALSCMVHHLLFEKGIVSEIQQEYMLNLGYTSLQARATSAKALSYGANNAFSSIGQTMLVRKVGVRYVADEANDNLATFSPAPVPASLTTNILTITGSGGDIITYDRTRTTGTTITIQHPKALVIMNILPESYTSPVTGISVAFPNSLAQTCNTTAGSANVTVSDGTAWSIGDSCVIPATYFSSGGGTAIGRVANIVGNVLTLVTQGGNSGVVLATVQTTLVGTPIKRVQYGVFAAISMDDNLVGVGKTLMAVFSDVWPVNFVLFDNTQIASANLQKFPSYFDYGNTARCQIDVPVGQVTFPNTVRCDSIDTEGQRTRVATGATSFGFTKNPLYLING